MPNGGSDCCGTCWFNSANDGKAGYQKHGVYVNIRCVIRDADIKVPLWTYCANHPHHNPGRIELPIGPVYVSRDGFPYGRTTLLESPDTEEIRAKLLELLHSIKEKPTDEYPTPTKLDETVVLQLGLFRERRAVDDLRRIAAFDPFAAPDGKNAFGRNRIMTIARAVDSLSRILSDDAIPEIQRCMALGLDEAKHQTEYDPKQDRLVPIRYWAVKSLEHCSTQQRNNLLVLAQTDPNPIVAEVVRELLAQDDA